MNPADILRQAADTIEERGKLRDKSGGERSMARAVASFNALSGRDESRLTELEGWLFMCCLKMARATAGRAHIDDYTDLAGYAALAAECVSNEEKCPANEPIGDAAGKHWQKGEPFSVRDTMTFDQYVDRISERVHDGPSYPDSTTYWRRLDYQSQLDLIDGYARTAKLPHGAVVELPKHWKFNT